MTTTPENLWLAEVWLEYRDNILRLLALRMPDVLNRRMSAEDLLQETYLACGRRMAFLQEHPEVPIYAKLRKIALQTLADVERHHLGAGKRDAMRESSAEEQSVMDHWTRFADSLTSPRSHMVRLERQAAVRRVLEQLDPIDRTIIELRHFEDLGNNECAAVLEIAPKAASIRYVRALKRFKELVVNELEV